jgi:hypothetical protein
VLVCLGLGNEEASEYLEFEYHNSSALIFYKPIVRAFSRIGDKFNLTRLPMLSEKEVSLKTRNSVDRDAILFFIRRGNQKG